MAAGGGTIGITGVDAALDEASTSLLAKPLVDANELVSIDLANGTIAVDLQQLGGENGLNGLPANTELLDADTIGLITGAITEALGTVTTKVGDILVEDVFNNVGLTIEIPAELRVALVGSANVNIEVGTTLGQLAGTADGEPTIEIDGNILGLPLGQLLNLLKPVVQTALITPLQGVIGGVLDTATTGLTSTLDGLIQPVLDTLSPVLSGVLTQVVSVTINEQPEPGYFGEGSFTVNALSLELLPNLDAVNVDLASSTVRAMDVAAEDPVLSVDPGTVNDGETTTVTGESYPPNTDVDVQLVDPDGNPVGDPVTVTTDENGGFTAELPVPEGSDAGDYTVDGTATTGETATVDLGVTNADDPTDDNTAENTDVNTEVNTDDNTDENTADNGDDNTAENTGDNTEVNSTDNTDENTADNGDDNTADNTAHAEIELTPSRAVQGVDDVLVQGAGYTPNETADVHLIAKDAPVARSAPAKPGPVVATVPVDETGEVLFRLPSSEYELGDYAVTVIDRVEPSLSDFALFTVVSADTPAEEPGISVDPSTVQDGDSTTVTGENFPPNTDVVVQLEDADGNAVGEPITVTTDDDGNFATDLPVPEGTEAGDHAVVASYADDEGEDQSFVTALEVTNAGGGDNGGDSTGDSQADNTALRGSW